MTDFKISQHFTYSELTATSVKADNTPTMGSLRNLFYLAVDVLEPVRELANAPVRVNSGYRSLTVNKAVGGVSASQHCVGEAADITLGSKAKNLELYRKIANSSIPFDQLIAEKGGQWLHISHCPSFMGMNRHRFWQQ